jgi:hypothetical protein
MSQLIELRIIRFDIFIGGVINANEFCLVREGRQFKFVQLLNAVVVIDRSMVYRPVPAGLHYLHKYTPAFSAPARFPFHYRTIPVYKTRSIIVFRNILHDVQEAVIVVSGKES